MTTLASDNFNRANASPIGAPWTTSTFNGLKIVSNAVTPVTANSDSCAYYSGPTWPADQWSQFTVGTGGGRDGGPAIRISASTNNCYCISNFDGPTGFIYLFRINGGSFSTLASVADNYANGDVLYLEIQGSVLKVKKNGTTIITFDDAGSVLTGGNSGIFEFDAMTADDWSGGDFASGGTTTSKTMTDNIVVTDQAVYGARRGRVVTDAVILSEPALQRTFVVTASDELIVVDETLRALRLVRVLSDVIAVTDGLVSWLRRRRTSSDDVSVIDSIVKSITGGGTIYAQTVTDTIVLSDGFVDWLRYRRTAEDTFEVTDGTSKTVIGAGTIYVKVQSDSVTLLDDAGNRWVYRRSTLSDSLVMSDAVIRAITRGRVAGDTLEIVDGTVTIKRLVRVATDNLTIAEEVLRTYLPTQTFQIRIRLGMELQPVLGLDQVFSLGLDTSISLGVDL